MEIDEKFRTLVERGVGCAVIIAGSGSDDKSKDLGTPSHIQKIADSLAKYGISYQVRVASGHKQSEVFQRIIEAYDMLLGPIVYIMVAGGTDAISGTSSFRSFRPTISCPPDNLNTSCLTNPPGSSNAYIGNPGNVGRFVAQMFSFKNLGYKEALMNEIRGKREGLLQDDAMLMQKYDEVQGR